MSKFNTTCKVPKKYSSGTIKVPKSRANKLEKIGEIQKLVNNEVLRTSKYHKKIESDVCKIINEDVQV
jgi:hypothetical protein